MAPHVERSDSSDDGSMTVDLLIIVAIFVAIFFLTVAIYKTAPTIKNFSHNIAHRIRVSVGKARLPITIARSARSQTLPLHNDSSLQTPIPTHSPPPYSNGAPVARPANESGYFDEHPLPRAHVNNSQRPNGGIYSLQRTRNGSPYPRPRDSRGLSGRRAGEFSREDIFGGLRAQDVDLPFFDRRDAQRGRQTGARDMGKDYGSRPARIEGGARRVV